jgi:hypothetical protein
MKKRKSRAFVPSSLGRLEERVVPAGVQFTSFGAAILTTQAFNSAFNGIYNAFARFATHGLNYGQLNADLAKAVSVIPYNTRDGLVATLRNEVLQMAQDINNRVPRPVISAVFRAQTDLRIFVNMEGARGLLVIR